MTIRPSLPTDLPALMPIFDEARRTIAALGIDQWQDGYPNPEVISADIDRGESYAVEIDGKVCGTFAMLTGGEPTYDKIYDGAWLTGDSTDGYLAIHRVAISVARRGSGISAAIINHAADFALKNGKSSLRIDTHEGNLPMRRALDKAGFQLCGNIILKDCVEAGDPRIAYELIL